MPRLSDSMLSDRLHACMAEGPSESRLLDVTCAALGATHAVLSRYRRDNAARHFVSHHLASLPGEMLSALGDSRQFRLVMRAVRDGQAIRLTDTCRREDILCDEAYRHVLRPLDGGLAALGRHRTGDGVVMLTLCRPAARGADFNSVDLRLLQRALPRIAALAEIAARVREAQQARRTLGEVIDRAGDGMILLDADTRMIEANDIAATWLAAGDRLRAAQGMLTACDARADARLQRAMRAICRDAHDLDTGTEFVLPGAVGGWPLIATLYARGASQDCADAAAILHLRDPGGVRVLAVQTLAVHFGLTPREADLARRIAQGATLAKAAAALEIGEGTARQYLKAVFAKIGVRSQADMVRLIAR